MEKVVVSFLGTSKTLYTFLESLDSRNNLTKEDFHLTEMAAHWSYTSSGRGQLEISSLFFALRQAAFQKDVRKQSSHPQERCYLLG